MFTPQKEKISTRPEASGETVLEGIGEKQGTQIPVSNNDLPQWASAVNENPTVQTRFSSVRTTVETASREESKSISEYVTQQFIILNFST